ncbi:hypothetical protein C4571_02800 [Candidatus Parcubacteria bacterium]|nr:MAG: hypothetical protein C4571_02800 [Candidatus Parcubacteria bacterium]
MPYKILLGSIATVVAFIAYVPYFINIFRGKTKPHAFSWLVWGVITSIGFFAQVAEQGGAGSWVTGFSALVCFLIFFLALAKGDRHFVLFDWANLFGAGIAILLWLVTGEPLFSVILVIIIDILGFLPTYRKGFYKPHEETATTFALNSLKFAISIPALEAFTLVTLLYPSYLVLSNGAFMLFLLVRRKRLALSAQR